MSTHIQHVDAGLFDYGEPAARKFRTSSRLIAAKHFSSSSYSRDLWSSRAKYANGQFHRGLADLRARVARAHGHRVRYRGMEMCCETAAIHRKFNFRNSRQDGSSKDGSSRRFELPACCLCAYQWVAGCTHMWEGEREGECAVAKCQHNWIRRSLLATCANVASERIVTTLHSPAD